MESPTPSVPHNPAEALVHLLAILDREPGLYLSFGYPQDRGAAFALQPGEHPAYSLAFPYFLRAVPAIVAQAEAMHLRFGSPREDCTPPAVGKSRSFQPLNLNPGEGDTPPIGDAA